MDIENVLKPFDDERRYLRKYRRAKDVPRLTQFYISLEKLCKSAVIEPILLHLFDLLKPEDYRLLFSSLNRHKLDYKWLEIFSKLCMKRYLEVDDTFFF